VSLESNLARSYWDRGILTNKIVYLSYVSIPNSGNVQTAETKRMRKYAELSIEMKQQWQVEAVYTLPVTICNRSFPHTHCMMSTSD